jgi:hypothetical protein
MVTVGALAPDEVPGFMVGRARIELTTNGLKVRCSTKLS